MNEREAIDAALAAGFGGDRNKLTASEHQGFWLVEFRAEVPGSFGARVFLIDPETGDSTRMPSLPARILVDRFRAQRELGD